MPPLTDPERMLVDAIGGLALQFTDQDVDEMLADGYSNAEGEQKLIETLVRARASDSKAESLNRRGFRRFLRWR